MSDNMSPCIIDLTCDDDPESYQPITRFTRRRGTANLVRSGPSRPNLESTSSSSAGSEDCIVDNDIMVDMSDASIILECNVAEPVILINTDNVDAAFEDNIHTITISSTNNSSQTTPQPAPQTPVHGIKRQAPETPSNQNVTTPPRSSKNRRTASKPPLVLPNETPEKGRVIRCPVCLENADSIEKTKKEKLVSTNCGHIFCEPCIKMVIKQTPKLCPQCRKKLTGRKPFHDIYI